MLIFFTYLYKPQVFFVAYNKLHQSLYFYEYIMINNEFETRMAKDFSYSI